MRERVLRNFLVNNILSRIMSFKKVSHCIFDLDGLLLDTQTIYTSVTAEIAQQYGKKYTTETNMKVLGTLESVAAQIIVNELQLPLSPQEFSKIAQEKVLKKFPKVKALPGVEKLLKHLHQHNIPLAVATSASEISTKAKITNHKLLFDVFHHKVMGSTDPEVKFGKPNPDIFLICASRFPNKPKPEQCLVFEDAPNGVEAALAAGMQVVMIPAKETKLDLCKEATLVVNSLEKFKPELFGLPPFEKKF